MSSITRFNKIKLLIQRLLAYLNYYEPIEGEEAIHLFGHRGYVGGLWNEVGSLQFEFLLKSGLKKSYCLFDIGCGSLRGGVHFIRYLNKGNYVGIDKNLCLIQAGIKKEMKRSEISDK